MMNSFEKKVIVRELLRQLQRVEREIKQAEKNLSIAEEEVRLKGHLEEISGQAIDVPIESTVEGIRRNLQSFKELRSNIKARLFDLGSPVPVK